MRGFTPVEAPAGLQFFFQRFAADQLHGVIQVPILNAKSVEPNDVGVPQQFQRFDLDLEALAKALLIGQVRIEHFDRRRLLVLRIYGFEYRTHATATEVASDFVRSELLKLHEGREVERTS